MSSHHIVKENQEPALIIANGQECSDELMSELLAWSPKVVVCDGAYHRILKMDIKPDVVIGDFDSIEDYEPRPDVVYIKLEEQRSTDLEKAIEYLKSKDHTAMNLIWATGKRLDHTVNNMAVLGKYPELHLVIYDDHSKAFLLPKRFKKRYAPNDTISLIPLGEVKGIKTKGLKYPLNSENLKLGGRSGSSNSADANGLVEIEYTSGQLILMEGRDEN